MPVLGDYQAFHHLPPDSIHKPAGERSPNLPISPAESALVDVDLDPGRALWYRGIAASRLVVTVAICCGSKTKTGMMLRVLEKSTSAIQHLKCESTLRLTSFLAHDRSTLIRMLFSSKKH